MAFVLLAVLLALAVYASVIGVAGRALRTGTSDLFGLACYGLPVGFLVLGGYLLWRHERPQPGRVAAGLALVLLSAAGIFDAAMGRSTIHQPVQAMRGAGGFVARWAGGIPLRRPGELGGGLAAVIDDYRIDALHFAGRAVFNRDLRFSIGPQVGAGAILANFRKFLAELVGERNREGHQFGSLVAGEAEHHSLIAGPCRRRLPWRYRRIAC